MSEAYRFIAAEKASYPVSLMSRVLGVNRTAFHGFERRPPAERDLQDAWLAEKIKAIPRAGTRRLRRKANPR